MWLEIIIIILLIIFLIYKRLTSKFDYFEKLGIPYVKPKILLGSYPGSMSKKLSLREEFLRKNLEFKNHKVYGVFAFGSGDPIFVINDLEILKKITIKDFDYFKNHFNFVEPEDDPLFRKSLFAMSDEKWHDMRMTLSPAFTRSKMRLMFQLILDICERAVKYLENSIKNDPNCKDGVNFEMKDFFTLFTNDAIASVAFGLDVNSLEDNNNEFYRMGKNCMTFSTWDVIKFVMYGASKKIFRLLGLKVFKKEFRDYFYRLVVDAMKYRKENNIVRQDMINMLMEAQSNPEKPHNREWTNEELVAQCFIFLFAGLESVATTLCFATQELIEHPDIQEKLHQEVDSVNEELDGKPLTYEALQKMKYMEMFISEVLRKWPPFTQSDRIVTKPYKIEVDGIELNLKVDDIIWIPIVGLHMNEENFPDPYKFDPERFDDENKPKIKQMSYGPFGFGPRACIGSRLALLECKAILFHILTNFELVMSEKTQMPIELEPVSFPVSIKGGFWLKMMPRK
ncbi:probable cytochrome P450 9f2 [Condylostylus longicornis]|uniref:probable cytochrome P450 9f2 n=1 Tax=Condylostylus longicornis TaxID=2530218 RepID=UPI00244E06D3|nr:probable cytochrome P450 9f2 [Condylostylus longicornis]